MWVHFSTNGDAGQGGIPIKYHRTLPTFYWKPRSSGVTAKVQKPSRDINGVHMIHLNRVSQRKLGACRFMSAISDTPSQKRTFARTTYAFHGLFHTSLHRSKLSTLRPRQNEQHFTDDIFKRIFFNENVRISIKISLKFVPKGPINNIPALVQIMAWRRTGDKPLSEPMMTQFNDAYMRHPASMC